MTIRKAAMLRHNLNHYPAMMVWSLSGITLAACSSSPQGGEAQIGTDGNDTLTGGEGQDTFYGRGGDDLIRGGKNRDFLSGDEGDDVISGGDGNDQISGGEGDDVLNGGQGDDDISGDEGDDNISGNEGDDDIFGDEGDDLLSGEDGNDFLSGDEGEDTISGGAGDDLLWGGDEDDFLAGDAGDDRLEGDDGDDLLFGGSGADQLNGGAGIDILIGFGGDFDSLLDGDANFIDALSEFDRNDNVRDTLTGGADGDVFFFTTTPVREISEADVITDFNMQEDYLAILSDEEVHDVPIWYQNNVDAGVGTAGANDTVIYGDPGKAGIYIILADYGHDITINDFSDPSQISTVAELY